jgi:hypothetical protein
MSDFAPRIALIHATALAVDPINAAFERHWPQASRMNLLDDSLSVDHARNGRLTEQMTQRFVDLAGYAQRTGCMGILFTCSAFGAAIQEAARATGLPTLKPNQAMFEQALALTPRSGALRLALQMARARGMAIDLRTVFVPQAMDDLAQGRAADHHQKIAVASRALADCDAVMLAQFSMAAAAAQVQAQLPCPVLSSPDCAVLALKATISHA